MKTKKLLILIFLLPIINSTFGQDFAPVGAEWYYNEQFAFTGNIDYIKFTSQKDTLINGQTCRKITKRHKLDCYGRPDVEFLFSRNDTIFFFDPLFNEFQNLYVLNANANDSWKIKVEGINKTIDTIIIKVDSIKSKVINRVKLKHFYVTYYTNNGSYPSEIIEKIGDVKFMFNWVPWKGIACDGNYTNGLRCYQDSELGFYSTGIAGSCDYTYKWVSIKNLRKETDFLIYPNPTKDFIQIESKFIEDIEIEVYDLLGCKLIGLKFNAKTRLDLNNLKQGFYILNLRVNDELIESIKVLKE